MAHIFSLPSVTGRYSFGGKYGEALKVKRLKDLGFDFSTSAKRWTTLNPLLASGCSSGDRMPT